MELGAGVELATSVVPHLFLPLACAANVAKVQYYSWLSSLDSRSSTNSVFMLIECICCHVYFYSYSNIQGLCQRRKHWGCDC